MYIRETINFAAIIHQLLISKNGKNKMYYFGLLSFFKNTGIYNVHLLVNQDPREDVPVTEKEGQINRTKERLHIEFQNLRFWAGKLFKKA